MKNIEKNKRLITSKDLLSLTFIGYLSKAKTPEFINVQIIIKGPKLLL
jgi:hypothetical protein